MAELVFTERFVSDASAIYSDRVMARLRKSLETLEAFPLSGSPDIPESVAQAFGGGVRKVVIVPFDLVYEYEPEADRVILYGLVPCREAR